jgi:hypothetical protein
MSGRIDKVWLGKRTYFVGGGIDDRPMIPSGPSAIPDGDEGRCGICWQSLRADTPPIVLPCHVEHRLHTECIERWTLQGPGYRTCPYCRVSFYDGHL